MAILDTPMNYQESHQHYQESLFIAFLDTPIIKNRILTIKNHHFMRKSAILDT